ncbi:MAG: FtsW/RodA/SpoVE family cell cycle protein [Epsilonproteobacteria bacterium]|nr:FtsW/RodA/SpoVE family cell cycle protein [Campylobacterota bacterium]
MQTDSKLFSYTSFLIFIGIIFSYSLTTYAVLRWDVSQFHFLIRQLIVGVISIYLMWQISRLNPDKALYILGFTLFLGSLGLMVMMQFLPDSLVTEVGGAKRWIKFAGISIAPVEFFKIGFIFFLAWSFSRKIENNKPLLEEIKIFLPYMIAFLIVIYLIAILQNDLGQVIVLGITLAVMAVLAGSSYRFFFIITLSAMAVFIMAIVTSPHRIARIKIWWANIQNFVLSFLPDSFSNYLKISDTPDTLQITNSLNAIKHGGFTGQGLANGSFKLGFLSEIHTDFVLSGIAEEIGTLSVIAIIFIFFIMTYRVFKISARSENKTFYLFSAGVALSLITSFLMNSFGVTSLTPIKGIAVPFLSYGGSSLLANAIAIGMVLMISKRVKL